MYTNTLNPLTNKEVKTTRTTVVKKLKEENLPQSWELPLTYLVIGLTHYSPEYDDINSRATRSRFRLTAFFQSTSLFRTLEEPLRIIGLADYIISQLKTYFETTNNKDEKISLFNDIQSLFLILLQHHNELVEIPSDPNYIFLRQ